MKKILFHPDPDAGGGSTGFDLNAFLARKKAAGTDEPAKAQPQAPEDAPQPVTTEEAKPQEAAAQAEAEAKDAVAPVTPVPKPAGGFDVNAFLAKKKAKQAPAEQVDVPAESAATPPATITAPDAELADESLKPAQAAPTAESKPAVASKPSPAPKPAAGPKSAPDVSAKPPLQAPDTTTRWGAKLEDPEMDRQLMPRRRFLSSAGLAWGVFALASAAGSAFTFRFFFPNVLDEPPLHFKAGYASDYPAGTVSEKYKSTYGVWIVNSEGRLFALAAVCTHLGCTPNWNAGDNKFKCPCHGSGFHVDGVNFEGPAPRPLERYRMVVGADGQLLVDKSRVYRAEAGEWSDPESFIAV